MTHIEMTAKKGFTNPRVRSKRGDGSVLPDETFHTDFLHAKELHQNKLAEPVDPRALDHEPTTLLDAHHSLSVGDHTDINKRRAAAAGGTDAGGDGGDTSGDADRTKAAAAALERVQTARAALVEAEKVVKDDPSKANRAKLEEAQKDYDAAEVEAKSFTGT